MVFLVLKCNVIFKLTVLQKKKQKEAKHALIKMSNYMYSNALLDRKQIFLVAGGHQFKLLSAVSVASN